MRSEDIWKVIPSDNRLESYQSNLQREAINYRSLLHRLDEAQKYLNKSTKILEHQQQLGEGPTGISTIHREFYDATISKLIRTHKEEAQHYTNLSTRLQNDLKASHDQIQKIRRDIALYKESGAIIYDAVEAYKIVSRNPDADVTYITMRIDTYRQYLEFGLKAQTATIYGDYGPISIPYINEGGPCTLHIPATQVRINLDEGELAIYPYDDQFWDNENRKFQDYGCTSFYSSLPTVHPHVLSNHKACMGDFGVPLREALDTGDIVSCIAITKMFLQQVYAQDPAGKTWYNAYDTNLWYYKYPYCDTDDYDDWDASFVEATNQPVMHAITLCDNNTTETDPNVFYTVRDGRWILDTNITPEDVVTEEPSNDTIHISNNANRYYTQ